MRRKIISNAIAIRVPTGGLELSAGRALIAAAREKAEHIAQNARERGFLAGLSELKHELREFREARAKFLSSAADEIVSLALHIAAEVVGEAVTAQPASLRARVLRAAATLRAEPELALNVNPADMPWLSPIEAELRTSHGVTLEPNPSIACGSARFLGPGGAWELDPEEHFCRIRRLLERDAE